MAVCSSIAYLDESEFAFLPERKTKSGFAALMAKPLII
jgi:hypothetical protein